MIILLNEETFESEWCVYEWTCAVENGIPILVVVDMERASKSEVLRKAKASPLSQALLQFQWIELVQSRRRDVLSELNDQCSRLKD